MADIQKTVTPRKTTVELIADTTKDGVTMEWISIDGVKIGTMGYANKRDKELALRLIQRVVDNSENTGYALYREIMETCMTGAAMAEEGISALESEEVVVDDVPVIINYEAQKAYIGVDNALEVVADLEDLDAELPSVAIKALLTERAKTRIKEMREEAYEALKEAYDEYDPDEDYEDEDCGAIVVGIRME